MFKDEYITKHYYTEFPPIKDIKLAGGFTWKELAVKMDVSEMCLWRWNSAGAHVPLEQRVRLMNIFDRYRRTLMNREDSILAKMHRKEKICIRCKHYVEHRIPESVEKHGKHTGFCWANPKKRDPVSNETLTTNADSTCNRFESLFD